jgi:hypothetical protein
MKIKEGICLELDATYVHWRNLYNVIAKEGLKGAWKVDKSMTNYRIALNYPLNAGNIASTGLLGIIFDSIWALTK